MDPAPQPVADLRFDTVVSDTVTDSAASDTDPVGVTCALYRTSLASEYFQINAATVCDDCRRAVMARAEVPHSVPLFVRALACGVAAAFAGAILYYAVIAITKFEIGFVALAIGYMVGYAIRWGARGAGGRRFQIAAVVLTYWSVGLAYTPVVFTQIAEDRKQTEAKTAASAAPQAESGGDSISAPVALGMLLAFTLALPLMVVFTSLPGGLLSALIIGIGMRQAWQFTAAPVLNVSGPYRIGGPVEGATG